MKAYLEATKPTFSVGEYWDSLTYHYSELDFNQDAHRQRIIDWINAAGGYSGAFDVTTKGILHAALEKTQYWRLSDANGKPPGVVGWWPSRAVTFIENHDTGSTQGHWRFPAGKEPQGYAYILTHPGTPCIFYDHLFGKGFGGLKDHVARLVAVRRRAGVHCRSVVKVLRAERDVYAAQVTPTLRWAWLHGGHLFPRSRWASDFWLLLLKQAPSPLLFFNDDPKIDDGLVVKIGPGVYEPPGVGREWAHASNGPEYCVWERKKSTL